MRLFIFVLPILFFACIPGKHEALSRQDSIKTQFNYDGSHKTVTNYILLRSDSLGQGYEHLNTSYVDLGEILVVTTHYAEISTESQRIEKTMNCEIDMEGNILKVFE